MKSLRNRLTVVFIILIGLSVLGTGIFVALLLKASYLESLTDRLSKEGELLAGSLNWRAAETEPEVFQNRAEAYSTALDAHITLIRADGTVVGDSERPPEEWGNLSDVPEVARSLRDQTENGYNRVTTDDRLFVYIPVKPVGEAGVQGVVRIALDLDTVNRSLDHVWASLTAGLLIAYLAAIVISSQIASRITKPLEEITQVAVDIARNKFHRRIPVRKRDEIGRLAAAINRMAAGLRYQLETIRKSERRLTGVIETMESGLLMVDSRKKVTLANQAIHRFFDIKTSQLLRKPLPDRAVFHDLHTLIEECMQSGERVRDELHLYFPEERIIEVNLTPIWGEKDGMGVVAVLHDITAIRRLEKMRTEFVANVSHELKTPVTSLRGFAETLLDGAAEDPQMRREFLEIIHRESLRLERLIGDLLDLSKVESRKMPLQLEPIRVKELTYPAIQTVIEAMKKKGLRFRLDLEEDFEVQVDKDRFSQIVINLLSNAMSYTPSGGSVTLSAGKEKDHWWIRVSDTGIGIPEEDLPRIFERFYRVDKARSRESGGTGLGLAIVKHLVESHHGEIYVDSQAGKGTAFTLRFPL
ncbi:two-component system histidine kinase PnpS [Desmospora profundinema]|uniref:histidine kinase n=1 Tax=Desmospora profundinema TaxID=1571184 RepID=A0ABU1IPE4_9BACL|nr:ATP-binding protein [Desmospora profundinema]MDR6226613.1 two-component system phosphate regulon sensor histidine kinase PhoR [Desmospora profundinema]